MPAIQNGIDNIFNDGLITVDMISKDGGINGFDVTDAFLAGREPYAFGGEERWKIEYFSALGNEFILQEMAETPYFLFAPAIFSMENLVQRKVGAEAAMDLFNVPIEKLKAKSVAYFSKRASWTSVYSDLKKESKRSKCNNCNK